MAEEQIDKPNNEETTKSVNKSGNKRGLKSNNKQNFANNPEAARAAGKKKSTAEGNVKQSMQQTLTEGRERRITPLIQQDIRNAMIQPDKNGHTYMYDFINAFLKEAKDNPNSQPARMLGSVLFNDKLLQTLDEQVNKEMAKEREFASYRIRKTLFPKQTEVFDCVDKNIITIAGRRAGKCFQKGTKFRMYNGSIVSVEDIKPGDILIDDESRPTEVISTTRGRDIMYRVQSNVTNARMSHVVNSSHILTLKRTAGKWREFEADKIYDIPLKEFIKFPLDEQQHFSLFRARTEYSSNTHKIDPYLLGLWLGDGSSDSFHIAVNGDDTEIQDYLEDNYHVSIYDYRSKCRNLLCYNILDKLHELRELNLIKNKHIPSEYIIDSVDNRLKLLAGLIDSDGFKPNGKNHIEISSSNKQLADDIFELCCSLGFRVLIRSKQAKLYGINKKISYTITIKGQLSDIPNVLSRKHSDDSKQRAVYGFNIEELPEDDYYGFTLSGSGRCLLSDYTVTHNTNLIRRILLNRCLRPGQHCLYMNLNFTNALNQCYDGVVDLAKELDIPIVSKSRAEGIIEFADDSYILFRGNSSIQDCEKTRGYSWTGIVVIDEIGSQKNLNYLIYDCIMPATKDATDSQILLAGTPPRIPHHTAEAIWNNPSWTHFHWDFRDNPYIPDHDSVIPDMCKAKGITPDSSLIKIELLGLVGEYDTDAMVYRGYKTYDKLPPQFNVTHAYIGVDPGYNDYTGIVGVVADRQLKQAYVIDEIKMNKCGVEDIAHAIIQMRNRIIATYGKVANVQDINGNIVNLQNIDANLQYPIIQFDKFPISVVIDTNEKNMNYTLAAQYKIPRVLAAWKHDKEMSIAQLAEWMRTGVIQIKKGGPVEDEALQTVYKRDPDTDAILNEIDDDIFHPDILDALRYVSVQFAYEIYQQGHTAREIAQELIRR